MKDWLEKFVNDYAAFQSERWRQVTFDAMADRASASPVNPFYEAGPRICREMPWRPDREPPKKSDQPPGEGGGEQPDARREPRAARRYSSAERVRLVGQALREMLERAGKPDTGESNTDEAAKSASREIRSRYPDLPEIEAVDGLIHSGNGMEVLRTTLRDHLALAPAALVASSAVEEARIRREEPSDAEWAEVAAKLKSEVDFWIGVEHVAENDRPEHPTEYAWCSLIYCYWLDEAGLPWTLERVADRFENGVVRTTRPLRGVHVDDAGRIAPILNKFASMWQRGDLPAVDERRRQYEALYGFPLLSASRWGQLQTVHAHHNFPAAFHGFLVEAMRFYRDSRNTQIIPDPQPAKAAMDTLVQALREGNENLRLRRPPEIRAQMEYTKRVLGGFNSPPLFAVTPALAAEWRSALGGRPGVAKALDPWQHASDTVAGLYGWRRTTVADYLALAERGETILVFVRNLAIAFPTPTEAQVRIFLALLQDSIQRYVSAYKVVARVDLGAGRPGAMPFLGAPFKAMARHVPAPEIPPLRRSWAAETPVAS